MKLNPIVSQKLPDPLPQSIPVFPLSTVLLLPGALLPLNIFEPRYLAMVEHALAGDRLIGMVHPDPGMGDSQRGAVPKLLPLGCVGIIDSSERLDDGRIVLTLAGVSRFQVGQELPVHEGGFRRVEVDWVPFEDDRRTAGSIDFEMDRSKLCDLTSKLLPANMRLDRAAAEHLDNAELLRALAMQSPLSVWDKQALLEASDGAERAQTLQAALECALAIRQSAQSSTQRH